MTQLRLLLIMLCLAASPVAHALQESDLTITPPPCKGKVANPKDDSGRVISNPHWVDIDGDGVCDIVSDGKRLNTAILVDPSAYYFNRKGRYIFFDIVSMDTGILAVYYLKPGGRPYFVMQGEGRDNELSILRWNPREKNFSGVGEWYEGDAEALTVLRFHVNFMIQQALIEIKKRKMKVAELYDEMVDMIADKFWISSVKEPVKLYFWKKKEFLDNAIGDANRWFADPPKKTE